MILPMQEEVADKVTYKIYSMFLKEVQIQISHLEEEEIKETLSKVDMVDKIEWAINLRI